MLNGMKFRNGKSPTVNIAHRVQSHEVVQIDIHALVTAALRLGAGAPARRLVGFLLLFKHNIYYLNNKWIHI